METKDERRFARMSLLDDPDADDVPLLAAPLTPQTPSIRSRKAPSITLSEATGLPTPPDSASSLRSHNPFQHPHDQWTTRGSTPRPSSEIPTSTTGQSYDTSHSPAAPSTYASSGTTQRSRGSSLSARWDGDETHRPLDIIRRESKRAHRSPHLRKESHHGPDIIDRLAGAEGAFHHEGPYDVASRARNRTWANSPLEAIQHTNRETLKSVHREKVLDAIARHRPLDGFAFVPPGLRDAQGRIFYYEEGTDLMRADGADYRRWPGIDYHPDDLKGKGEPSFSLERALKASSRADHRANHRRIISEGGVLHGIEMGSRPHRTRSLHHQPSRSVQLAPIDTKAAEAGVVPMEVRRRVAGVPRKPVVGDGKKDA